MIKRTATAIALLILAASAYGSHLGSAFERVSGHLHDQEKFLHYLAATDVYKENCSGLSFIGTVLIIEGVKTHDFDMDHLNDYGSYREGHRVSWLFYQLKGCKGIVERFKKFGLETTLNP